MVDINDVKIPQESAKDGKRAYQAGEYDTAARAFAGAAEGFSVASDEIEAAEMRNNQAVALLQGGRPEAALQALEGTDDIFAQAGDHGPGKAGYPANIGVGPRTDLGQE